VNLICDYFSQFGGSTVSVAYNGYDICTKCKEYIASGVDIYIETLDRDMPIMDGRKVCDSIRQYEKDKRLKPVLINLIVEIMIKSKYINNEKGYRADCFLRKPVSFSEFIQTVYNLVTPLHFNEYLCI